MRYILTASLSLYALAAIAGVNVSAAKIDRHRVTVSGISSGALMAQQLHIAYSDIFSGAAILSGGPFGCSDGSMITGIKRCMNNTENPLPVPDLLAGIRSAEAQGTIAETGNLADDRVWMFHGTEDHTISVQVHEAARAIYEAFVPNDQIHSVNDIAAGHVFPADGRGNGCTELKAPFVGDCGYDAAGELLRYLYPGLSGPASEGATRLQRVTLPGAEEADLLGDAFLFVPPACTSGDQTCALHLVLHGCAQSAEAIGTEFIEQSGYLPWAEANDIVVAFPQVKKSLIAPLNPHACWDWWGYTGDDYLTRNGRQMAVLADWIESLAK